jgi:CMP-N-acetylneuraminic acid synthetase
VILTSDSEKAIELAKNFEIEVPFIRPRELSEDETEMRSVILHALKHLSDLGRSYTHIILLQPTSPFRTGQDIDDAWKTFSNGEARTLISVTQAGKYASNFMYKGAAQSNSKGIVLTSVDGLSLKPVRRQDLDQTWWRNGAIYIFETENITKLNEVIVEPVLGYEMPWHRSINIDELQDVHFGEYLWESQQNQLHE